jgi:threonine synthase
MRTSQNLRMAGQVLCAAVSLAATLAVAQQAAAPAAAVVNPHAAVALPGARGWRR